MREKKNLRRVTLLVTAQTAYNLDRLAAMCGYREPGHVVDKLVREKVLGNEYDISRLAELVQADNDGRIRLLSAGRGKVCKECAHFIPVEGQKSGDCRVKEHFRVSQSHSACYRFEANKVYPRGKGEEKL